MPTPDEIKNTAAIVALQGRLRDAQAAGDDRQAVRTQAELDARIRIEERRNKRREQQCEARGRKEQWEAAPASALPRHSPQRQAPAGRWQDHYSATEFERQFGYPPPAAEDEPEPPPAPGDDGIPF